MQLAEHLPLEQGLRHTLSEPWRTVVVLAEHLPLEQGLRPIQNMVNIFIFINLQSIFH